MDLAEARELWIAGYGPIVHDAATVSRIDALCADLSARKLAADPAELYRLLASADRLASAAMWVVAHMTYARRVDLEGGPLGPEDFKKVPEGHTGGALNVVPAYVGYFAANVLSGRTRSWMLGQGHCVAAIEAVNSLLGNLSPRQEGRYGPSQAQLSQLCADFYSYAIDAAGRPGVPLGSHVNPDTAGGISEGGYLGFAEIQYVHAPLPGESLVAILSDGAFEEQRGGDWAERWWRAEDSGLVCPVMILNGRRIEQRTEIAQDGGAAWLAAHLAVNGFDPFEIDGRDPSAFVWAILESEARLEAAAARIAAGTARYPVRLPYAIATTTKGFGFPGAGSNRAHNLPLEGNPKDDPAARDLFNEAAARLFVPPADLQAACRAFQVQESQGRPAERDHPLASRRPQAPVLPAPSALQMGAPVSAMAAVDGWFVEFVAANPGARFRIANPDELASNQMGRTLSVLRHRVKAPEPGAPEDLLGSVITALNEEAVIGAALGNKGGINLAVSYEAFAVKMLGALRQDIIFARQQAEIGRPAGWIGLPVLATSHLWENGKNQQSHQDPAIGEILMGEMSDVSRVIFAADASSAIAAVADIYRSRGVIGCIVAPKRATPVLFDAQAAARAVSEGAAWLEAGQTPRIQLVGMGAYQIGQAQRALVRLREAGVEAGLACILEPGRLRAPRDELEAAHVLGDERLAELFPLGLPRVICAHTRPEPLTGILRRIDPGAHGMRVLGYINRGGTLDTNGMLFANRSTWAHMTAAALDILGLGPGLALSAGEIAALEGRGDPGLLS